MSRKKQQYQKKSFESNLSNNDTSANIYMSMLLSPAWQDLKPRQQTLYLHCKAQYYGQSGKRAVDTTDNAKFYFNRALWCGIYKLYNKGNQNAFYKDMESLILHGFIKCTQSGRITRTKSIYQYSNKWKVWGTDAFSLLTTELTPNLIKNTKET